MTVCKCLAYIVEQRGKRSRMPRGPGGLRRPSTQCTPFFACAASVRTVANNQSSGTLEIFTSCVLICRIAAADPLYVDRAKVVTGELEPPAAASEQGEAERGIPEFWLNVLRADETVGGLVRLLSI
jgi:hypothetical protein